MNVTRKLKWLAPTLVLGMSVAVAVFAQSPNPSAGESMDAAGHAMENAGSDTADAAKDTYHGAATAVHDTEITSKVKTALHEDKATEPGDIHVKTVAGVVTLRGQVPSDAVSARAQQVAESTDGVRGVKNELNVAATASNE
jgi:hyperosmotically inducible periplasmic protein